MPEKFRLHTILRLRESVQEERRTDLGQAVQAQQILESQTENVQKQLVEIEDQIRAAMGDRLDVDHLMALRRFQAETRGLARQLDDQRQIVEQEIERRQSRLTEASREVQVIEKLRTKHRERHQALEHRREQEQLDEFAQRRTTERERNRE